MFGEGAKEFGLIGVDEAATHAAGHVASYRRGYRAGLLRAADAAEDCIANGVIVVSAKEVGDYLRKLASEVK